MNPNDDSVQDDPRAEWRIDALNPHPINSVYPIPSSREIQDLADDIAARGLDYYPEILPDGTILRGHRRVQAMKLLGWTHTLVSVMYDIAKLSELEIFEYVLLDNMRTIQLGQM